MHLTKSTHSSVRLRKDGRTLVVDPGVFGDPDELLGADAILITHEHPDHFDEERVRKALEEGPGVEVWTQATVAGQLAAAFPGRIHVVGRGDAFAAAGFDVKVYGEHHAPIHRDMPASLNVGFLVDDALFHPGDAFLVPDRPVETLLFPVAAPWSKVEEVVDYIREVAPGRSVDIHDAHLTATDVSLYRALVTGLTGPPNERLAVGEGLVL